MGPQTETAIGLDFYPAFSQSLFCQIAQDHDEK